LNFISHLQFFWYCIFLTNRTRKRHRRQRSYRSVTVTCAEIPLARQRPAQYVFSNQVQMKLPEIRAAEGEREGRQSGYARFLPAVAAGVLQQYPP
jgi:hypothetical protein